MVRNSNSAKVLTGAGAASPDSPCSGGFRSKVSKLRVALALATASTALLASFPAWAEGEGVASPPDAEPFRREIEETLDLAIARERFHPAFWFHGWLDRDAAEIRSDGDPLGVTVVASDARVLSLLWVCEDGTLGHLSDQVGVVTTEPGLPRSLGSWNEETEIVWEAHDGVSGASQERIWVVAAREPIPAELVFSDPAVEAATRGGRIRLPRTAGGSESRAAAGRIAAWIAKQPRGEVAALRLDARVRREVPSKNRTGTRPGP